MTSNTVNSRHMRRILKNFLLGLVDMIKTAKRVMLTFLAASFSFSAAHAASGNSSDLLQYIPADTPYVFASTEPMPAKLADKLEPTIDEILQSYQSIVKHMVDDQLAKMTEEDAATDEAAKFQSLTDEVINLLSLEGIRGIGIERNSAFAMYGNGLLPVIRFELSEASLFDAAIARIEEKAETAMLIGEADGESYKYIDAEKMRFILATLDDQAVMTVIPNGFDEAQVAMAIGAKTPRKNLKKSKGLRGIQKEYGYTDHMLGYIDIERIAGVFAGNLTDSDRQLFAAVGEEPPELTETCSAEILEMAGIAPRIVFGYSEISTDQIKSSMVVELRKDIAAGLATIPAAVPGLGLDFGGLMSFGVGLSPLALREFYEARLDAMEASPYECEQFADLQAGVAKGREALNQPLPPVVYSFRGFVANVEDIQGMDMANSTPPESVDASILIAMENAEALVMMAAMMDPQIAALNLLPDGKPVKLEMPQLAEIADLAFAALSADALTVSFGENAEKESAGLLNAAVAKSTPFMSMSMDSARYYSMIGDAMAMQPTDDDGEPLPPVIREALRDVMVLSGSIYERMSVDVQLTERGIEIGGLMQLGD